jgi:LPS-assembly protein
VKGVLTAAVLSTLAVSRLSGQVSPGSYDTHDPFAARFKEKSRFELKIKKPTPGGRVRITAREQNCEQELTVCTATGDVEVEYQDIKIRADRLTYDRSKNLATAEGHLVIDQGPTRIAGRSGTFNLDSKTGLVEEAEADLQPAFHIIAKSIAKVGEATYEVTDGIFTSCSVPDPAWSFHMETASITLDDYARLHQASFYARKVPLLYSPYLLWPTKEGRVSGFLVPGLGYNSRRGGYLGLTYYWVTGTSTDATTGLDLYTKRVAGIGQELRWAPSKESAGVFQGFLLRDPQTDVCVEGTAPDAEHFCILPDGTAGTTVPRERTRWKLRLDHSSDDLPADVRAVVSIRDYSDINYLQDFERTYTLSSASLVTSSAFATKNLGPDSLNLRLDRTESFLSGDQILERLPGLELSHRPSQIGETPFYAALEASAAHLFVNRGPGLPHGSYEREDLFPSISLPFKGIPWLSLTARGSYRWTRYSDSFTPPGGEERSFTGEPLTRKFWEGELSMVGPSFSRIYDFSFGPFVKWKHVIEPRVDYNYRQDISNLETVPDFDDVDYQAGRSSVRYSLVNRLLAKGGGENAPSAQEVASLEISQTYNFREFQVYLPPGATPPVVEKRSPVDTDLRVTPAPQFYVEARWAYDTNFSKTTSYSLTGHASGKDTYLDLSWNAVRPILPAGVIPLISPDSDLVRASAGLFLFSKNWRLDTQLNYDVRLHRMLEDRSLLAYNGSCYTILLELRNYRGGIGTVPRHDYRLVVNLKNIGTLLDLNGGLDKLF